MYPSAAAIFLPLNLLSILSPIHPSSLLPSLPTLGPHYVFVQKAHHPILSIFLLNLVHSLHIPPPFLLTLQIHFLLHIHYPPHLPDHPIFFYPLHSSFLTPEHTFPPFLSVCRLNSAVHHSSFYRLPPCIFLPLHPFHPCVLSPHSSSLCQTEISSLCPQATSSIISSPLSMHYPFIPHLLPFLTLSHPFSHTILLQ